VHVQYSVTAASEPTRRLHPLRAAHRRYRRARWSAVALGGMAALLIAAWAIEHLQIKHIEPNEGFFIESLTLLAAGLLVPWLAVEALWQRARRRHFWDWQ
jgi:hypothetical protein